MLFVVWNLLNPKTKHTFLAKLVSSTFSFGTFCKFPGGDGAFCFLTAFEALVLGAGGLSHFQFL